MSYIVEIITQPVHDSDNEVLMFLDKVEEEDSYKEPNESLLAFYNKVVSKYPCITEDENGPWSDGPLINNFHQPVSILGISFSRAQEVVPWLINAAKEAGYTLYDPQDNSIHRPSGSRKISNVSEEAENQEPKPWWKIW